MLSKKMLEAINSQINAEYYSSYLYLSMAAFCEKINLKGFANWLRVQAAEELTHAIKFFNFVLDRRGDVTLAAIAGPPTTWASPEAVFEATLEHEQHVTGLIGKLFEIAVAERDYACQSMLKWFIDEQVEEESNADQILQELKLAGNNPAGLYMIDQKLAARTFVPAPGVDFPPGTGAAAAP